jgi:hypothetical protein
MAGSSLVRARGAFCGIIVLFVFLCVPLSCSLAQSQSRGTEQAPSVVQAQDADQTKERTAKATTQIPGGGSGWFAGWGLSDKIAGVAIIFGFLQFVVLVQTVQVMARTARQQLRAYVTTNIAEWSGLIDGNPLAVRHLLIAFGQSPAKQVRLMGKIDILPHPLPEGFRFPLVKQNLPQSTVIFPDQEHPRSDWVMAERPFTAEEIAEITSYQSAKRAYMFGKVTYVDIFNKKRVTTFRSFLDPESIGRDKQGKIIKLSWLQAEDGNDFR